MGDFLKIQHQYSDHPKMKGEEPPKKPDGEGGTGKEEEDSEGPVAMDDDGDVDREEEEDELDDLTAEEYSALDRQLDSLNSALDAIEQRNDDIHDKLRAILRENKEARESLKGGRSGTEDSDKGTPSNVKEGEPS